MLFQPIFSITSLAIAVLSGGAEARRHVPRHAQAGTATSTFQPDPTAIYEKMIEFTYADTNNGPLPAESASVIQSNFMNAGVSAVSPYLYDVDNTTLHKYANFTDWLHTNHIPFFPAVGGANKSLVTPPLNTPENQLIAQGYANISRGRIRIENTSQYFYNNNTDFIDFLNYLTTLGFTNIQLNPWPQNGNGAKPVEFGTFPSNLTQYLQSAFQGVVGKENSTTGPIWEVNQTFIDGVFSASKNPSLQIMVYYESPTQQETLASYPMSKQEDAFTTTIQQLNNWNASQKPQLHWVPPLTKKYDPLIENTWGFIERQFNGTGVLQSGN